MLLKFYKYQGTGNDFVLINNLDGNVVLDQSQIAFICDRKFGIGADGLMLLEKSNNYDFEMKYYNSDGNIGSMCGNGGRCIVKFAHDIGLISEHAMFLAVDGVHEATINEHQEISLEMINVDSIIRIDDTTCELNTGSPHLVKFIKSFDNLDVVAQGRQLRNSAPYVQDGINVNFVLVENNNLRIRTYERGVENETLSCGTGVTAAALSAYCLGLIDRSIFSVDVKSLGGDLRVSFDEHDGKFSNIVLSGPALKSFEGEIEL